MQPELSDSAELVSYAQHGEDIVLWRAFRTQPTGTYVDVGAFDPDYDSVTRLFYERGWRGVNIDPSASAIERFNTVRPQDTNIQVAAGEADGVTDFFVVDNPGWSTTNAAVGAGLSASEHSVEVQRVPMRRLSSLLDEHQISSIDFLKVDVEGSELAVLAGIDFDRHRPRVLVIEGVAPVVGTASADRAIPYLEAQGYAVAGFDGLNHYLTIDDSLVEPLSAPANPTDGFARFDTLQMRQHIIALTGHIESLQAELDGVRAALDYYNRREPEIRALEAWAAEMSARLTQGG